MEDSAPVPEIPAKNRSGPSRVSNNSNNASRESSQWSLSGFHSSSIIEMGQAFPLEIGHIDGLHEVSVGNLSNTSSRSVVQSSLPPPLKERIQVPKDIPRMRGHARAQSAYVIPRGKQPLDPTDRLFYNQFGDAGSSSASGGNGYAPSTTGTTVITGAPTPPEKSHKVMHQHSLSDAFVTAQESIEDLRVATRNAHQRTNSNVHDYFEDPLYQPSAAFAKSNHSRSDSSGSIRPTMTEAPAPLLSPTSPSRPPDTLPPVPPPASGEMRKSETLRKLQRIISDDDNEDDVTFFSAIEPPANYSFPAPGPMVPGPQPPVSPPHESVPPTNAPMHAPPQPPRESAGNSPGVQSTPGLRLKRPQRGSVHVLSPQDGSSPITPHKYPPAQSTPHERQSSTHTALDFEHSPPHVSGGSSEGSGGTHGSVGGSSMGSNSVGAGSVPERRSSRRRREAQTQAPHRSLQPSLDPMPRPTSSSGGRHRRNFTKKSLEDMMQKNPSPYDISDIGLPKPERVLLEKFIDALSKLSIEVQMDEGKREEGRRRMNNALRALEGWF